MPNNDLIRRALQQALDHVVELREAWMTGAISECDGKGGTRSNRNVDVEMSLRAALDSVPAADAPAGEGDAPDRPPMLLARRYTGMGGLWLWMTRREADWTCQWHGSDGVDYKSRELWEVDRTASDPEALKLYDADLTSRHDAAPTNRKECRMSEQAKLKLVVTSTGPLTMGNASDANGWGEDAKYVEVDGQIADLRIEIGGHSQFGIRILPNAEIIITDYAGMAYPMSVPQGLRLSPHGNRGWFNPKGPTP